MADSSSPSASPQELQQALSARDSLIERLTAQLEQTADQLDRLRRSGADRGARANSSGGGRLDAELIERLESMLSQWEESQPHEVLQRIEKSLEQKSFGAGPLAPQPTVTQDRRPSASSAASIPTASAPTAVAEPPKEAARSASGGGEEDFWAKTRARLMGLDAGSAEKPSAPQERPSTSPSVPSPSPAVAAPSMGAAESRPDAEKESQVDSPPQAESPSPAPIPNLHPEQSLPNNLPKPVDLNASRDDLIDAVDARDEYILYLTTKLRTLQGQVIPVINWEVVNNCPDDLKKGVQGIAAQLEQQLKEAELSISLERANLGRERAKLMKVKEFLETQVMKLGGQQGAAGNEPPQDKGGKAAGDKSKADMERRWNRLFSREK